MTEPRPGDIFRQDQVLNHTYVIEGLLGRGGTGEVYRARNLISERIVAIKALNAQFSAQDGYIELMRREEQMRDIRDDAVVRYTECSRSEQGHVFLVMDFIDGPSIADVMATRRMEPRELLIICHRIAGGLAAAHRHGIIHRDLSPDNIILRDGSPERTTIIDFGIAKDTAAGARTIVGNDFAGKYEYAAPEQLEGRAEPRSDLYALGALLLAAFRGQIPFAGATPGEMIRRKQAPLETDGVPDPLKGVIEWLTAPAPDRRPPSAEAVAARLDQMLPKQSAVSRDTHKPRFRIGWLAMPLLLAIGIGAAFWTGLVGRAPEEALPLAAPYQVAARFDGGTGGLTGHAADEIGAATIRDAFAAAAGTQAPPDAIRLARGEPLRDWPESVARAFRILSALQDWRLDLSDLNARITGTASDADTRDGVAADLNAWATAAGITLQQSLAVAVAPLSAAEVQTALDQRADCGALSQAVPPGSAYGPEDAIVVQGHARDDSLGADLEARLRAIAGPRAVQLRLNRLNADLCAVRALLPDAPDNALSIWMGDGATGAVNLSGIYRVGDNPVVEVLAPASLTGARLWVVLVNSNGQVFNLIPNGADDETALSSLGTVQNGLRRIRVLFSADEFRADNRLIATTVSENDFGKNEIIALLANKDLFDTRRPRDESVAAFAEALRQVQTDHPGIISGSISRVLETRP